MGMFTKMVERYEVASRHRVLMELRSLSSEQLLSAGISAEKLNRGVSAWPWRLASADAAAHWTTADGSNLSGVSAMSDVSNVRKPAAAAPSSENVVELDSAA